jgi:hypothetical protein
MKKQKVVFPCSSPKLDKALDLIRESNKTYPVPIDIEKFKTELTKLGATSDDALRQCTWEDLGECGLPKLLARQVAQIFRQESGITVSFTPRQLVERYAPVDKLSMAYRKLVSIAGDKRFVVFDSKGQVDVDTSSKLLEETMNGYPPVETVNVKGRPCRVYRLGERPTNMADQNPVYPTRPLRPDQTCDQTNRSWNGVDKEVRQIVLLAITRTKEASVADVHTIIDLAISENAVEKVRVRFNKASILYDELVATESLPSMKISLSPSESENNPFGNRTY